MNSKWRTILVVLAFAGLSGCASMSGDECTTSDWHAIGFEDGSRGYAANRLGNHRKACAKHGVTPDFAAYQAGHDQGLVTYCQPSRGFSLGTNGGSYNGVCSAHGEGEFVDAYNSGYHLYNLRSRVNSANSQIYNKRHAIDYNEEAMTELGLTLVLASTTAVDRLRIIADIKNLAETNGQLEAEVEQLVEDRAHYEHELASYEATLADTRY